MGEERERERERTRDKVYLPLARMHPDLRHSLMYPFASVPDASTVWTLQGTPITPAGWTTPLRYTIRQVGRFLRVKKRKKKGDWERTNGRFARNCAWEVVDLRHLTYTYIRGMFSLALSLSSPLRRKWVAIRANVAIYSSRYAMTRAHRLRGWAEECTRRFAPAHAEDLRQSWPDTRSQGRREAIMAEG